ncbi:MAG: LysM peptidoglycan-binding domain-containing protein [Bacillota bacterium]
MRRPTWAVLFLVTIAWVLFAPGLVAEEAVLESVEFFEADLRDVFRSLGLAGQYNVLLTKDVQGTATISLRQKISVRDAIELIARTYEYDLRWLKDNRMVIIGKSSTLQQNFDITAKLTKVFNLHYSTVNEIADALKVVVDTKQLALNPRTNQVTVVGSMLELENVEEIIRQMDRPMPQVNIEARMEEVVEDSLQELGLKWSPSIQLGIGSNFSILSYSQVMATLNLLENQNKAVLLAQPNVSCLDSQEATIFIGDRYPVTITNIIEGKIQYSTQYVEIGTKLTVKPRVNLEDIVTVQVKAEVSSITKMVDTLAGQMPVIRTRTTESMTRLRNGQTFVLTGLIRREDTVDAVGVPLLSKLPVLSALFKSKRTEGKNTVICVFLTPSIKKVAADELPSPPSSTAPVTPSSTETPAKSPAPEAPVPSSPPGTPGAPNSNPPTTTPSAPSPAPSAEPTSSSAPVTEGEGLQGPTSSPKVEETAMPTTTPVPAAVEPEPVVSTAAPGETSPPPTTPEIKIISPLVATPSPGTSSPSAEASPAEVSSVEATAPSPVPAAGPAPESSSRLLRPEEIKHISYTVKKGETLSSIGRKFGLPWQEIAAYNNLGKKTLLYPGQVLLIPIPDDHKYIVKPKDTLWRIAKRYGLSVDFLAEINELADATKLEVGQVIVLPCPVDRVVNPEF